MFTCPECGGEIVFWENAIVDGGVKKGIQCPHCNAELHKKNLHRTIFTQLNPDNGAVEKKPKRVPVMINYSFDGKRYEKVSVRAAHQHRSRQGEGLGYDGGHVYPTTLHPAGS